MLYVSTRNIKDTYTAYRAIHETVAPDGGVYVPFHLTAFTPEELSGIREQSCCETLAQILNLLFALKLSSRDVECVVGAEPIQLTQMQHKLIFAECWKNPQGSWQYLLKNLYGLILGDPFNTIEPAGWPLIGIEIALLFGAYCAMESTPDNYDVAVTADDFADVAAVLYSRIMGLPVNMTVCACTDDSSVWSLLNKEASAVSTFTISENAPDYWEAFLCGALHSESVSQYVASKGRFSIDEDQQDALSQILYAAVVSASRVDPVIGNMYATSHYAIDAQTALAYGGLQDYRAATGVSRDTLILTKERPARAKE